MCEHETTRVDPSLFDAPAASGRVRLSRRVTVQRGWRLVGRLARMSPGEVRHRVQRLVGRPGEAPLATSLSAAALDALWQQASTRFLFGPVERARVGLFATRCPSAARDIVAAADALAERGVSVLGHPVRLDAGGLDWCADPCSGRRLWPMERLDEAGAVRCARAGATRRLAPDVKLVWELSRHQFLPTLGAAFWLDRRAARAAFAIGLVESWLAQNPAGVGVNWSSVLEVGLRAVAWLWGAAFLGADVAVEVRRLWMASLVAHYEHLRRNLSSYTDTSNHLIGEATALWLLATTLQALPDAAAERSRALAVLAREAGRQVTEDGVSQEQAFGYHCFVLELYLQVVALARRHREELPALLTARVREMLEFLGAVSTPCGEAPRFGDSDDGRGIPFPRPATERARVAALLEVGSALLGTPATVPAEEPSDLLLWLVGPEALRAARPDARRPGSRLFRSGGYAVLAAHTAGGTPRRLIFDVGGFGTIPNAAHAHADALGIVVDVGRASILGDPGTGTYGASAAVREAFRSTRAHNTLTVDGLDQADALDTFKWVNLPRVTLGQWAASAEFDYAAASHDGYLRLRQPVLHARAVLFARPHYWLVVDRLSGRGRHAVQRWFHFPPEVALTSCGDGSFEARAESGDGLRIVFLSPTAARRTTGPWSSHYGAWDEADALVAETDGAVPMTLVTFLAALGTDAPEIVASAGDGDALCRITVVRGDERVEDTVTLGADGAVRVVRRPAAGSATVALAVPPAERQAAS